MSVDELVYSSIIVLIDVVRQTALSIPLRFALPPFAPRSMTIMTTRSSLLIKLRIIIFAVAILIAASVLM